MLSQDLVKTTNKDIEFRVSFVNDTLDLREDMINIIEIENHSDSIFLFYPNAIFQISKEHNRSVFADYFILTLNMNTKEKDRLKNPVEVLPYTLLNYKYHFKIEDKNVFVMAKETLYQKDTLFNASYISPLKKKKNAKRITLSCLGIKAFVRKYENCI